MSFFLKKRTNKTKVTTKRKRKVQKGGEPVKKKPSLSDKTDLDISSESEIEEEEQKAQEEEARDNEEFSETPEERKLRLAKKYLEEIEREEKERLESQDIDKSLIQSRLTDEESGVRRQGVRNIADLILPITSTDSFHYLKNGHKQSVTCVCMSPDYKYIFSGGKEGSLIKWDFKTFKKIHVVAAEKKNDNSEEDESRIGHCRSLTAIAITSDSKFLATADGGKDVRIWNPEKMELIHRFEGHRGPVTGLVFRRSTHSLYTCSQDRTVKVWDADEMTYVECLFGHQEPITAIDSLFRERAITAGGRDTTIRLWKISEESQLVFQGSGQSIDCVKFLDEQHFISAGEDGSISFWGLLKKKPLCVTKQAHGIDSSSHQANWITCIAALANSNIFASGSSDGFVRLWKTSSAGKQIQPLFSIPVNGFVNALEFSARGDFLVVGVGQEHRLGRWWRVKQARNQIIVIPLLRNRNEEKEEEDRPASSGMRVDDDPVTGSHESEDLQADRSSTFTNNEITL